MGFLYDLLCILVAFALAIAGIGLAVKLFAALHSIGFAALT